MTGGVAAIAFLLLLTLFGWLALRRYRRAARGYAWFLGMRRYVLRGYARRRDGRTYHPARNPDVTRLDASDQPSPDR
jgi:hypothetical protein